MHTQPNTTQHAKPLLYRCVLLYIRTIRPVRGTMPLAHVNYACHCHSYPIHSLSLPESRAMYAFGHSTRVSSTASQTDRPMLRINSSRPSLGQGKPHKQLAVACALIRIVPYWASLALFRLSGLSAVLWPSGSVVMRPWAVWGNPKPATTPSLCLSGCEDVNVDVHVQDFDLSSRTGRGSSSRSKRGGRPIYHTIYFFHEAGKGMVRCRTSILHSTTVAEESAGHYERGGAIADRQAGNKNQTKNKEPR